MPYSVYTHVYDLSLRNILWMASILLLYVLETYYIKSCKLFEGLSPHAFENPKVSVASVSSTYKHALPPCLGC